ncbi:MAG: PocR ligand-binding domain-containing protein [Kiritimatiellales bacterium]|jgi:PAS domain S-box-containing protein
MIWIDLIYNMALLVALSVISGFVGTRWNKNTRTGLLLQGAVFGGAAVIGMLRPFVLAPGLIFDGRTVMISLGGLFFGPWTAATACLMTIPVRIIQGGPGMLMGVLVILVSALVGTGSHRYLLRKPGETSIGFLLVFGLAVHLAMLAMTIVLPQDMIIPVLKHIGWPVILIYPPATVLIGKILTDHAARNQLLQTLKENAETFRAIADYTVEWESWFGPDGKYLWVSPSVERITGYSAAEVLAMPDFISTLVAEEDRDAFNNIFQKALRGGTGDNFEFRCVHKNGSIFWLGASWQTIFDEKGRSLGVRASGRDITERKQMQKEIERRIVALTRPLEQSAGITFDDLFDLAEIQRIQDEFSDATGVTSAIFRPDGTEITTVSNTSRFCRHVVRATEKGCANCLKSDKALGQAFDPKGPVVRRCPGAGLWDGCVSIMVGDRHIANWTIGQVRDEPQTEEQALQYAREIGADEQTYLEAFRELPCMSGEHFKQIAQALFTLANQLSTSAYQNIQQARFIAERQKAEENLLRLSTVINQTVEAVVVTDVQGIIQYVNPAFEFITGHLKNEAVGKSPRILKSGRHEESFYRTLWQTISSGRTWTGQFINKRKNGTLYTEEATVSPVYDPGGNIMNYVAVKRDITNELNKEEEYRQAQKMEAVGQLAGGVAHDFNNILQAILGFSEILLGKLKEGTSEHRNVAEIKKAAGRAAGITRQLLAFSRKQPVEKKQIDINTVIQDTEVLLQLLLGDKISRVLDLAQNLNPVEADSGQMTQIIMNLAINARDSMPEGGRLTVSTENIRLSIPDTSVIPGSAPGEFICLSVTDTGCGMSREVKDHLFEPFFTTKEPGKGTGLGLAGIYGIVKKHKGWINVYSEEGMGTAFKVYLPALGKGGPADIPTGKKDEPHREHILLVEDDLEVRNMVVRLLQDAGYLVSAAASVKEALVQFDREQGGFNLLFSDIVLPDENGIELADRIRKTNPDLPVLLYSGYRDQRERWSNLDSKGYHFLQKPFTVTTLLAAVYDTLTEAKKPEK